MTFNRLLLAALLAVFAGLDRTAFGQFMLSRPIVIGPLTGLLLGEGLVGLQIGALVELLWLGRLPVGAAIPPDDTQVTIGATLLTVWFGQEPELAGPGLPLLATLVAMPLGKVGQYFDRLARHRNGLLLARAEEAIGRSGGRSFERFHLAGMGHFALAALATFAVLILAGAPVVMLTAPLVLPIVNHSANWLLLLFPLVGTAVILGTINVNRSMSLFAASFATALLLLWLA